MPQSSPKPLPLDPENPYVLVPLHQYPEFTFQCATLLNLEWPRSRQARLNSLWSCSKNFPVAMVLVQSDVRQTVGFCKISLIPSQKHSCFVESVVIHPDMRGKGLGSLLMKKLEEYVLSRKLQILYLSTLGQEKFYKKLGYDECEPVSLYAFGINSNSSFPLSQSNNNKNNLEGGLLKEKNVPQNNKSSDKRVIDQCSSHPPSPPPPPPPPPFPKKAFGDGIMTSKTYMRKELTKS
ncbi:N-alpha-acetyltransferase 80 [Frankliniella fusca]|uniref:N-alpha-acetyltransferase 80 n=1 Tax=Frankliniella fusca TaxID=407009 RepID=A0AAE1LT92_9NEOP|nr:N-alpha-acetyltransferase 80 [Frankliniella fusca]